MSNQTLNTLQYSDRELVCNHCKQTVVESELVRNYYICPKCHKYMRIPPRARVEYLVNANSFSELFGDGIFTDPINFPNYKEKIDAAKEKSGENEGVLCGRAMMGKYPVCIFVMNPEFMMGSMGTVVGDRITALFEYATLRKLPVIGYTVSGGARMQEGILSLMQMEKVSMAVKRHSDAGLFYLVCATDPTMGGITASYASIGDIIIAEPGAQIGFAGKRVIEQNIGEKLPEDFQSAEFQLQCGFLDDIVPRQMQREYLIRMLSFHERRKLFG